MDIICEKCKSKFRLPDHKIPTHKKLTLPCPKCKNRISVGPREESGFIEENGFAMDTYDTSEKPFDFIEEEGNTALICENDTRISKKIVKILNLMEYHITVAENARDALKKMRYHQYDLILINEGFNSDSPDSNMVILYLERLSMDLRRNIYVAMLSNHYRTQDQMTAYRHSVNIVINVNNVDDLEKILQRGLTDHELFYRQYIDSLKKAGRL